MGFLHPNSSGIVDYAEQDTLADEGADGAGEFRPIDETIQAVANFQRSKTVKNHVDHTSGHQELEVSPQEDYFGDHYIQSAEYQWKCVEQNEVSIIKLILPAVVNVIVFFYLRNYINPENDRNNYVESVRQLGHYDSPAMPL